MTEKEVRTEEKEGRIERGSRERGDKGREREGQMNWREPEREGQREG